MPDFIDLTGSGLGQGVPPSAIDAAKAALDAGATHYTTRPGLIELRQAVAERMGSRGRRRPEPSTEVLVTCGIEEALFVAVLTTVGPGDEFVVVGPSPAGDEEIAAAAGGDLKRVSLPDFQDDLAKWLDRVASQDARAILVRNPTVDGLVVPRRVMDGLSDLAVQRNIPLLEVVALADFLPEAGQDTDVEALPAGTSASVTIGDFSAWGLEGWRVGYLTGPVSLVGTMTDLMQALSICAPALGQFAALAALQSEHVTLDATRALLASRVTAFRAGLSAQGLAAGVKQAGPHMFMAVGADRAEAFVDTLMRRARVRVELGATWGVPGSVRIALTQPESVLLAAAGRISECLSPESEEVVDG